MTPISFVRGIGYTEILRTGFMFRSGLTPDFPYWSHITVIIFWKLVFQVVYLKLNTGLIELERS
ncbi:hypothetical protein BO78DRAFT_397814, partial [Aspergillus sclerotiicarbonarius CBS 121057]